MGGTEQRAPQPLRGSSRASKTTPLYSCTSHTYLTNDFCASIRCQGLLAPRWYVSRGLGLLLPQVCLWLCGYVGGTCFLWEHTEEPLYQVYTRPCGPWGVCPENLIRMNTMNSSSLKGPLRLAPQWERKNFVSKASFFRPVSPG